MGQRKYPPLTQAEMRAILIALGFSLDRSNKHPVYVRPADGKRGTKMVPCDGYREFDETLIKRMIDQSGFTRKEFYGATRVTALKIGLRWRAVSN